VYGILLRLVWALGIERALRLQDVDKKPCQLLPERLGGVFRLGFQGFVECADLGAQVDGIGLHDAAVHLALFTAFFAHMVFYVIDL
jgi:hypothetical protein